MLRWPACLLVGTLCLLLGGCTQLRYYTQAAQGQYALWSGARPIDAWSGIEARDVGGVRVTRLCEPTPHREWSVSGAQETRAERARRQSPSR